jgi:type I restriction enzyme M protein
MDYWAETMQDDAWQIALEGWKAVLEGKPNTDLIPEALIVARYFAAEQAAIENLEAGRDAISRRMEALAEEHGGEDGLLEEAKTDKGKLSAKSVKNRLKPSGATRTPPTSARCWSNTSPSLSRKSPRTRR